LGGKKKVLWEVVVSQEGGGRCRGEDGVCFKSIQGTLVEGREKKKDKAGVSSLKALA